MRERLKRAVLKTAIPERVSGVQIPLPPPDILAGFLRLARRGGLAQDFGARLRRRAGALTAIPERLSRIQIPLPPPIVDLTRDQACPRFMCGGKATSASSR